MQEPDKKRLEKVFLVATRIAECVSNNVQKFIEKCGESSFTVNVNVDEDWPYEVTVEVRANSEYCGKSFLEEVLEKALDECMEEAVASLEKMGLEALP